MRVHYPMEVNDLRWKWSNKEQSSSKRRCCATALACVTQWENWTKFVHKHLFACLVSLDTFSVAPFLPKVVPLPEVTGGPLGKSWSLPAITYDMSKHSTLLLVTIVVIKFHS